MEHSDVGRTMAVERYLLGEMSSTELEEFEEHIFACSQCADEVRSGVAFVDNARAVFRDEPRPQAVTQPSLVQRWWERFSIPMLAPAFAALLLLCVSGYQRLVVIPGLERQLTAVSAPQALTVFALPGLSRGAEPVIKAPAAGRFSLYFDVATPSASGYSCEFRNASGRVVLGVTAPDSTAGTIYLSLARPELPAGDYTLVVRTAGAEPKDAGQYPFKLEYQ